MDLQFNRAKVVLTLIAISMAISSFWLTRHYLDQQEQVLTQQLTHQFSNEIQVVVANQDLAPGTFLSSDVLAVAEAPAQFLPIDIISPEDFSNIDGLELKWSVPKGKPILSTYLGNKAAARFSDTIPPGFRAITIEADTLNSHENMIEVGDHVDLFRQKDTVLDILLEMVKVIATGNLRSASQDPDGSLVGDDSNFSDYQSITLLMPIDAIAPVLNAKQSSQLLVLLRNANDTESLNQSDSLNNTINTGIQYLSNKQSFSHMNILSVGNQPNWEQ